ncbi:unnamed protein product [Adineta steineri]|uniref:RRM domain-containing protein n=1 Tax=Adineta steineri TaxID=433720 RepID=A0A819CDE1_9BILA|nr:unnamed protein product [Adineta steineri]
METRVSRLHSNSSSLSRSRSPISNNERRSISASPRRKSSTPVKSSTKRNHSDEEQDPEDRELLALDDSSKNRVDETSSPIMSDTDENQQKKRSHHRHHHRHHKPSKSTKRSATHQRPSVKRSKKETVSTSHHNKSDGENSINSPEKNTSESEQSPSKQQVSSSDNESNNEEGMIEENNTPSEHRSHRRHHRHHKKHHSSSSINERNSQSPQSSIHAIPKNNKGTQLIVNYLPASLREADFYQLFARVGSVKLCKLITNRHTGHSYCYGFIEYHTKEDAIKAIEKYNGYGIEHKKLKVAYAEPKLKNNNDEDDDEDDDEVDNNQKYMNTSVQKNPNIYITELPDDFDEKMLKRLFSKYGEIVQAKILRDPRTRISRGVGFVLMTSTRYAERAVKVLDGYVPSGSHKAISVRYADPKKTVTTSAQSGNNNNNNNNNNSLSRLSSTSSMVGTMRSYGYPPGLSSLTMIDPYYAAALHHHHHQQQHRAVMNMRELSPSPPPPASYYASGNTRSSRMRSSSPGLPRSYSSSSSSKHNSNILTSTMTNSSSLRSSSQNPTSLAAAYELISKGCQQAIDPNGFVLYAFGLPRDCDENELEDLFRRYGDVYRVYIVKNYTTGESKGYSFVTMRNYDEACHAVDCLHNSTFQGRTIQVRFKQ